MLLTPMFYGLELPYICAHLKFNTSDIPAVIKVCLYGTDVLFLMWETPKARFCAYKI